VAAAVAVAAAAAPAPATAAPAAAEAHARITGVVRTLKRPVAGVTVIIPETGFYALTDSLGRFSLGPLGPGLYTLRLAAVGYAPQSGTIAVGAGTPTVDSGSWLLKPLRPDGSGVGMGGGGSGATPGDSLAALEAARRAEAHLAQARLADSLAALPSPAPVVTPFVLELTAAERSRWVATGAPAAAAPAGSPEALLHDLLVRVDTADSITAATRGTGAPGVETWRQWGDRFAGLAADTVLGTRPEEGPLTRRALAYARTRQALTAGPTWNGWQAAKQARVAIQASRAESEEETDLFLGRLLGELDRVFVSGTEPPQPKPEPASKGRKKGRSKASSG
jgi:hypothetical protein